MVISVKLDDNKFVDIRQAEPGDDVQILHVNSKGEFVGVAVIPAREFAQAIENLVPEDKKDFWR